MNPSVKSKYNIWWGPPKKFSTTPEESKISWLELFYDLVYVIVISRTTHYLAMHPDLAGVIDYGLLFIMVFWGWLNGSMYYDLHGSPGIRTRFMTLWQMVAVAALAVALFDSSEVLSVHVLSALIILQIYITYLWWSVGIYDKEHRKLNVPYTVCYIIALALIFITLFIPAPFKRIVFFLSLVFNFLPSFIVGRIFGLKSNITVSPRMVERLGLLTIIVFGEVILGVISGTTEFKVITGSVWILFLMGILIVFSLFWIFFSLLADREVQPGLVKGRLMSLLYIPTLASLGIVGAAFSGLIHSDAINIPGTLFLVRNLFGISLSVFLISICAISYFLKYPVEYESAKKTLVPIIISSAILVLFITLIFETISALAYLIIILIILIAIITTITRVWFKIESGKIDQEQGM